MLRYRPAAVTIRLTETSSKAVAGMLRVASAGSRVQQAVASGQGTGTLPTNTVSLPQDAPREVEQALAQTNAEVVFVGSEAWLIRVTRLVSSDTAYGYVWC